jgi:hypothetical protein
MTSDPRSEHPDPSQAHPDPKLRTPQDPNTQIQAKKNQDPDPNPRERGRRSAQIQAKRTQIPSSEHPKIRTPRSKPRRTKIQTQIQEREAVVQLKSKPITPKSKIRERRDPREA